jgi:peptidyl-tRNA hydrolase, PTH1 family
VPLRRRDPAERRGAASEFVIVGLANPDREFEGSRHNVGGDAVRAVAARRGATLSLERRQRCLAATIDAPVGRVTLAIPTTYMNESGASLPPLLTRTSLGSLDHLVVAHDELDFEPGRLQLKLGGGLAGHNGLRSIAGVLKTREFSRLRIGIGKPSHKDQGTSWVLKPPTGERQRELATTVSAAADALERLIDDGFVGAQQFINGLARD